MEYVNDCYKLFQEGIIITRIKQAVKLDKKPGKYTH